MKSGRMITGTNGASGGGGGVSNLYHQNDKKRGKGVAFFGSRGK